MCFSPIQADLYLRRLTSSTELVEWSKMFHDVPFLSEITQDVRIVRVFRISQKIGRLINE